MYPVERLPVIPTADSLALADAALLCILGFHLRLRFQARKEQQTLMPQPVRGLGASRLDQKHSLNE